MAKQAKNEIAAATPLDNYTGYNDMEFCQAPADNMVMERSQPAMDQNLHVWWAKGQKWVVKWENERDFHWPETEEEPDSMGTPPGTYAMDPGSTLEE